MKNSRLMEAHGMSEWIVSAKAATMAGGLAGAAVSVVMGAGTFWNRFARGFVGAIVATIFGPLTVPITTGLIEKIGVVLFNHPIIVDPVQVACGNAFVLGVCGMVIAQTIMDLAKAGRHKIRGWFRGLEL